MNRSFEQLKNELGRRVGPLLPDVPSDEFEQLIELMAILQCRHEMQRSGDQSADTRTCDGDTAAGD